MRRTGACLLWATLATASGASAQGLTPGPPGPYVIDARVATIGVPADPAFFPPVPSGTAVPSRAFGVDLGGHVYLIQFGPARVGIGASYVRVRGTASPVAPEQPVTSPGPPANPDVEATFTALAPQISFNFGTQAGWSYLSAGYGRASIRTSTSAFAGPDEDAVPAAEVGSGARAALNLGGGARWFLTGRVGIGFDVRFHFLPAGGTRG